MPHESDNVVFNAFQHMTESDLRKILNIVKTLASRTVPAN